MFSSRRHSCDPVWTSIPPPSQHPFDELPRKRSRDRERERERERKREKVRG